MWVLSPGGKLPHFDSFALLSCLQVTSEGKCICLYHLFDVCARSYFNLPKKYLIFEMINSHLWLNEFLFRLASYFVLWGESRTRVSYSNCDLLNGLIKCDGCWCSRLACVFIPARIVIGFRVLTMTYCLLVQRGFQTL